jgi:hypothetical protein
VIDFDATVLAACQAAFARPVVITPTKSQPGAAAYPARGIWTARPVEIGLEDNSILVSQDLMLGLRRSEFTVLPQQGDTVEIPAAGSLQRIGVCAIDRINTDDQGDVQLYLKKTGA